MSQELFNTLLAVVGALSGWWMKIIWRGVKDLQKVDDHLTKEVTELKVLVAGQYITRPEFMRTVTAFFNKLDRIEDKLDRKEDKT